MKSALKVGILTLSALSVLLFTVLWLKGKAISGAERITVSFKDVNGMREGSGVQMMGVRIGQVEEIIPRMEENNNHVDIKFVITEPDIIIPRASEISIQQSGIIGEQFLEITPPKEKIIYIAAAEKDSALHPGDKMEIKLGGQYYDAGIVKNAEEMSADGLPALIKENIKTKNAYKITYTADMPGLILPDMIEGRAVKSKEGAVKLRLAVKDGTELSYPASNSPYTIIEPMRIADFLELQKRSAGSLIETNERISMLLSDDVIKDLQEASFNVKTLTEKAQELLNLSSAEIAGLSAKADELADNLIAVSDNLNKLTGGKDFAENTQKAVQSFTRLSDNISSYLEDAKTQALLQNLEVISKNTAELSAFVNDMSKDTQLKKCLKESVQKLNSALDSLKITLDTINYAAEDKDKIKETIDDVSETSENLRKFSEKLNRRFLIFRLLF